MAAVKAFGTSAEPPEVTHWGLATRSSWIDPSHTHAEIAGTTQKWPFRLAFWSHKAVYFSYL